MITYELICEKLGYDIFEEKDIIRSSSHEDDSKDSPFANLTTEELSFLSEYLIKNRQRLTKHIVK